MEKASFTTAIERGLRERILDLLYNRVAVVNYGNEEYFSSGANINDDGSITLTLASMAENRMSFSKTISSDSLDDAKVVGSRLCVTPIDGPDMEIQFLQSSYENLTELTPDDADAERLTATQRAFVESLLKMSVDGADYIHITPEDCKMLHRVLSSNRVSDFVDRLPHPQKMDAGQIIMNFSIFADYSRAWDMPQKDFHDFRNLLLYPLFGGH